MWGEAPTNFSHPCWPVDAMPVICTASFLPGYCRTSRSSECTVASRVFEQVQRLAEGVCLTSAVGQYASPYLQTTPCRALVVPLHCLGCLKQKIRQVRRQRDKMKVVDCQICQSHYRSQTLLAVVHVVIGCRSLEAASALHCSFNLPL